MNKVAEVRKIKKREKGIAKQSKKIADSFLTKIKANRYTRSQAQDKQDGLISSCESGWRFADPSHPVSLSSKEAERLTI